MILMAPDKIQRVLTNLVDNAIKYAEGGERVTLRAWRIGDEIRIDIHNSGSYIPQDVLPRLFESFYRGEGSRKRGDDGARGTGLGLAIARGFIEAPWRTHLGHQRRIGRHDLQFLVAAGTTGGLSLLDDAITGFQTPLQQFNPVQLHEVPRRRAMLPGSADDHLGNLIADDRPGAHQAGKGVWYRAPCRHISLASPPL